MILYSDRFWISPWVFSCWVTLKEKGVPFDVADVALDKKETHKPEYKKNSTTAKVPALDDGGFWLSESSAIIEYLEDKFPSPPALPTDPQKRARARQLMSFLRTDVYALRDERSTYTMFYEHAVVSLGPKAQADADKLIEVASAFVPEGAASMFGDWCIADSELAFCMQRLGLSGFAIPPRLRKFVESQWSRPSVTEYVSRQRAPYVPY